MTRAKFARALPQGVHVMPLGHSVKRLCGATTGAFIRERDEAYLAQFLRAGGGLCPECRTIREQLS
jgi:hypothetical protein